MVHDWARGSMVQFQHRRLASQQVLAHQLWFQVPCVPHHVSHVHVFCAQLRCHCMYESGSFATHCVKDTVRQDHWAQCRFLLLRGLWECVAEVYSGVV